jgi:hypothetical protein
MTVNASKEDGGGWVLELQSARHAVGSPPRGKTERGLSSSLLLGGGKVRCELLDEVGDFLDLDADLTPERLEFVLKLLDERGRHLLLGRDGLFETPLAFGLLLGGDGRLVALLGCGPVVERENVGRAIANVL